MTGREWKPGDVAMLRWQHYPAAVAVYTGKEWVDADNARFEGDEDELSVRPLVLVDPEDREQVERLRFEIADLVSYSQLREALDAFADPKPPRPDEPQGLGAVIEDTDGRAWVRTAASPYPWMHASEDEVGDHYTDECFYADINVARVHYEGWSE